MDTDDPLGALKIVLDDIADRYVECEIAAPLQDLLARGAISWFKDPDTGSVSYVANRRAREAKNLNGCSGSDPLLDTTIDLFVSRLLVFRPDVKDGWRDIRFFSLPPNVKLPGESCVEQALRVAAFIAMTKTRGVRP